MTPQALKVWIDYVKQQTDDWPHILDDERYMAHWMGRLYLGRTLFRDYKEYDAAYEILKEIYLGNEIRHNSDWFGSYEEYMEEKVNFFKDMAELSYIVTKEAARSIPFIDEALIMLDASESVGPYVDVKEFKQLKKDYQEKAQEE